MTTIAAIFAGLLALFTFPALVVFILWTLIVAWATKRWQQRLAKSNPGKFAEQMARDETLEAEARAKWQNLADKFNRAVDGKG
jgi:membrane protein implicated in regulation of membrane protease activity